MMSKKRILLVFVAAWSALSHGADTCISSPTITVIGTGYIGLVTGAGLAEIGNKVICADIEVAKIEGLKQGIIPIYEPGLDQIVAQQVQQDSLEFTSDVPAAIRKADIIFIAVGTPMSEDGSADLSYVKAVVETIARNLNGYKIICTKSTVPVGTGHAIREFLRDYGITSDRFDLVSNPEFLREGSAVNDFLSPDRIIIGVESERGKGIMTTIYQKMIDRGVPILWSDIATSEMIKYASNGFLATKVSYINEMANLCKTVGADIYGVAKGMGLDSRIGNKFLIPGPGFGGSCFPKDCQALLYMAKERKIPMRVVQATLDANAYQQTIAVNRLKNILGTCDKKVVAILGLAFKANTDDVRYSPSIATIKALLDNGAVVRVYDPIATKNMQAIFSPDKIAYCQSSYDAAEGAHAVLIMTEWPEFKILDIEKLGRGMVSRVMIDMRGMIDRSKAVHAGFIFDSIVGQVPVMKSHEQWWERNIETFRAWTGGESAASRVQVRNHIKKMGYMSILDIGCGLCVDFNAYAKDQIAIKYQGLDVSQVLVDRACAMGVPAQCGSVEAIPYEDSTFDVCYTRHLIEHLDYYQKAIAEMVRVAKREVLIVFFIKPTYNPDRIVFQQDRDCALYYNHYNKLKLEKYIQSLTKVKRFELSEATDARWQNINGQEVLLHIYLNESH